MQKIVIPVDLEEESSWRKALPTAIELAQQRGAELHLLTVVPDRLLKMTIVAQVIPEGYEERLLAEAEKRLAGLVERQVPSGMAVTRAVRHGSVAGEILRYAQDVNADLVIMASHRPEVSDYLLGPNAAQVARHARSSVWIVRE